MFTPLKLKQLSISIQQYLRLRCLEYLIRSGELVMAIVSLKPGATLNAQDLISFCRQSLGNYKVPRRIEFTENELPKSGSGKILKRVLREKFWSGQKRAVG